MDITVDSVPPYVIAMSFVFNASLFVQ